MKNLETISKKIFDLKSIKEISELWSSQGETVAFTNGVFDILHLGHIDYLSKAKDCGNKLIVGVNTDFSAKQLGKGNNRPITNEKSRSMIIASLQFVDAVVLFNESTPYELIKIVQPDILVKGADYKPEEIVGYDVVTAKNGEVKTIEFLEGYSTTAIEKKIKNS